jgi:triosephosphate isomerase
VGETLAENEAGRTAEVVMRQMRAGVKELDAEFARKIVIAYEPVWAIGTGRASTGENANAVVRDDIRKPLAEMYASETAETIRVLYGGSVTAVNAAEFFSQSEIDGALVGGASLKVEEFAAIVKAAVK